MARTPDSVPFVPPKICALADRYEEEIDSALQSPSDAGPGFATVPWPHDSVTDQLEQELRRRYVNAGWTGFRFVEEEHACSPHAITLTRPAR